MLPHRSTALPFPAAICLAFACVLPAWGHGPFPTEFDAARPPAAKRPAGSLLPTGAAPLPGENFAAAIVIDRLPFTHAGSTCGYRDDYLPACTFLGGAPDIVFAYTPAADECVDIDLCMSTYDTAVHVYVDSLSQLLACNDDLCGLGSQITALHLEAQRTYYVVVDGWYTNCGDYNLQVNLCPPPCRIDSLPGELAEGEPQCTDGYFDRFNTGCNDYPYVFSRLWCDSGETTIRGTYGTWRYYDEEFRDTDWYRLDVTGPTRLEYEVTGGAMTQIAILDGSRGCPEYDIVCGSAFGRACETVSCQALVPAGTYFLFVAPRYYQGVACGTPYRLRLRTDACATVGVTPITWSRVKLNYK